MRIKHPDTFRCDLCGTEMGHNEVFQAKLPVIFTTEQNEGRPSKPYVQMEQLDLCRECLDRYIAVAASGAMGVNDYRWRDGR